MFFSPELHYCMAVGNDVIRIPCSKELGDAHIDFFNSRILSSQFFPSINMRDDFTFLSLQEWIKYCTSYSANKNDVSKGGCHFQRVIIKPDRISVLCKFGITEIYFSM